MEKKDKKLNVKRLKTVSENINNDFELGHNISDNYNGNIVNITINNNFTSQRKINSSRRKDKLFRNNSSYNLLSPKNDIESFIKKISSKNVQHLNININYNQIQRKSAFSVEKKRISSLWTKTKNFQKMLHAFIHPSVVKIDDKDIFCDTLKNTLLDNNSNLNNNTHNSNNNTLNNNKEKNKKKKKKYITLTEFLRKSEVEKEFIRVNLKEKAFKLIIEGVSSLDKTKNIIEEFEDLFNQNPEKKRFLPEDKHYLFNQRLSNGKTLLYIACQEGATDIVKYFLEKKLNPNIKAIYFDMEDSCLAVAARWNYYDIVKLILESNTVYEDDILDVLKNEKCSMKIKNLIFSFIPEDKKNRNKGCGCF